MSIENTLKRRDKINTQIEILEQQNIKLEAEIAGLLKELNDMGVKVDLNNLDEVHAQYANILAQETKELEELVKVTERELEGVL